MTVRRRRPACVTALVAVATVLGASCADDGAQIVAPGSTAPPPTVDSATLDATMAIAVCTALRDQTNVLVGIANTAVTGIEGKSPAARSAALLSGFDQAIAAADAFEQSVPELDLPGIVEEPELRAEIADGATFAAAGVREERESFAADVPQVEDGDVRGRVGQFFNGIEKAMSVVEPAIATYDRRELQEAFLDEPSCRHVIQPFRLD